MEPDRLETMEAWILALHDLVLALTQHVPDKGPLIAHLRQLRDTRAATLLYSSTSDGLQTAYVAALQNLADEIARRTPVPGKDLSGGTD